MTELLMLAVTMLLQVQANFAHVSFTRCFATLLLCSLVLLLLLLPLLLTAAGASGLCPRVLLQDVWLPIRAGGAAGAQAGCCSAEQGLLWRR
jgi:hypothetical protein